jgi:hypothetical protein
LTDGGESQEGQEGNPHALNTISNVGRSRLIEAVESAD